MPLPSPDLRTAEQQSRDEQVASEPVLPPPDLSPGAVTSPVEAYLPARRPVAVAGVVEDGLVRPLDPAVSLPGRSRVIIVATGG